MPDVEFYSLQKGEEGEVQLREMVSSSRGGPTIIDYTQELHDFSDTAALIDNLDLVISVCTSLAHLAGALGKPVWIMLRFDACWRWLMDREDSPWYPTARLFRQSTANDWSNVVTKVRAALEEMALHQAEKRDTEVRGLKGMHEEVKPVPHEIDTLLEIFNQGRYAKAVELAQAMTELFPRHEFGWKVLGAAQKQLGRNADALAAMQKVVELLPRESHSHSNLGAVLNDLGRLEEAEASCRRALEIKPDDADAHYNLGVILKEQGRVAEAETYFLEAIRVRPAYAEAHNNLGILLKEQGRLAEAETRFRESIRIRPEYAEAHNNLGNTLQDSGRQKEAEASFRRAIRIRPDYAGAHNNLGNTLQDSGRLKEAEASFREAIQVEPEYAEAHSNLGITLQGQGRLEEAEACFRRAIQIRPDDAELHGNLGHALMELGQMDEAEKYMNRALDLAPGKASPLATALLYIPYQKEDPRFSRLEEIYAEREALSTNDRISLDFSMGKAMENIGEYDRAYCAYEEANRLHFEQRPYDEARDERLLEKTTGIYTADLFNQYTALADTLSHHHDERVPIFIVGMLRSGSTLIEQILASHPAIFGAGELVVANSIANSVEILEMLLRDSPNPAANLLSLRKFGREYLDMVWKLAPDASCITDKQLDNFLHLGLIHLMLPKAKIIHAVREPMGTCFSCYATLFRKGQYFSYDQGTLGRHYVFYRKMMAHWRNVLPAGRILDVRYEDNVANPEREARRMLDYLGLPWDPACLRFHETKRVVSTASVVQVRKPIYSSSVARWKRFEKHLNTLRGIVHPAI
jgi:tetratricopeptide (TPR) repeat protein